jgi:hypothetical protein
MDQPLKILTTINSKGEGYASNVILDRGLTINGKPSMFWFADCDEDKDGSPDWSHDPTGQNDTSLHYNGKPIDGNLIPFIVVPDNIANLTKEMVLGCIGVMEYMDKVVAVVVGDAGPHNKVGEASSAALASVGAPTTRNGNGGVDGQEVFFRIWPGVPAKLTIDGQDYQFALKHWGT